MTAPGCASLWNGDSGNGSAKNGPELVDTETTRFFQERARNLEFSPVGDQTVQLTDYDLTQPPQSIAMIPDAEVWHMTLLEAVYLALSQQVLFDEDNVPSRLFPNA